jgi:hypothetical protein
VNFTGDCMVERYQLSSHALGDTDEARCDAQCAMPLWHRWERAPGHADELFDSAVSATIHSSGWDPLRSC